MSKWLVRYRWMLLSITLALSLVCGWLMLKVNINTDMTLYLPKDSPMRAGLALLQGELGMSTDMIGNSVNVMTDGQANEAKVDMRYRLSEMEGVESVTLQENGSRTLYQLAAKEDADLPAMANQIRADFPDALAVETSQDGLTADAGMLIGALSLLLIVLIAMCASWLEPVLFLASTGIAVLLNMGSNALLPNVSVTTHSIAAILQLVLSMDYSIILINRYRQERGQYDSSTEAMQHAIRRAAPSVISSAMTTIVGLLMLVFMKLRIGADLGIVLSKGVFFSLICNFTVLPSLILIFEKGIERSKKKVLALPTDRLARFSMKYRVPLMVFFVLLLGGSYWMHNRTPISFHREAESQIAEYFPQKNPFVIVYDNADEDKIAQLMDEILEEEGVEMALSYPSLMLKQYRVEQMVAAIQEMSGMVNGTDSAAMALPLDMVSEDVLRMVYYAANGQPVQGMSFETLVNFILTQSKDPNSFIASQMSDDIKSKMAMYDDFRRMDDMIAEVYVEDSIPTVESEPVLSAPVIESTPQKETMPEHQVSIAKAESRNTELPFADTIKIKQLRTSEEMAHFLGMDPSQAKMAYRLAKKSGEKMSAVQFVHFLTDDILKRKALASMISAEQRQQLQALRYTMDSAFTAKSMIVEAIVPAEETKAVAEAQVEPKPIALVAVEAEKEEVTETLEADETEDDMLSLLDEMMTQHKRYTAAEMARNFAAMGEPVETALIEMLYMYYGGMKCYDNSWQMSLSEMLAFLGDSLMNDPRMASFITDEMRSSMAEGRRMMAEKLQMMRGENHSAAVVVTGLQIESDATYAFIARLQQRCGEVLSKPYYLIGESVMMNEMKGGFGREMTLVTLLTIIAIFIIVAFSFKSWLVALLLVSTVMTGVFVDVSVSAFGGGSLLFMAYLIVQSILMGSAIDYGILFTNYYREHRRKLSVGDTLREAYKDSIHTILTSGLILILVPGAMAFLVADATVSSIVGAISIGALATVLLMLLVLPGMLATCDKAVCREKNIE
ncbi:MAG: MMPL family transporter [Bacteroidales bacterium]|nr:MMPL family transporter [Candidatus Colimorpha merdihippi]